MEKGSFVDLERQLRQKARIQHYNDASMVSQHLPQRKPRQLSTVFQPRYCRRKYELLADDFCTFCKEHRSEILGRRLNADRLSFVQTFVFPPSHMELLPVRESKKERAAYEEQMKKEAENSQGNGEGDEDSDWGISA